MTETPPLAAVSDAVTEKFCEECGSEPCSCCPKCHGAGAVETRRYFSEKDDEEFCDEADCDLCGGCGVWP